MQSFAQLVSSGTATAPKPARPQAPLVPSAAGPAPTAANAAAAAAPDWGLLGDDDAFDPNDPFGSMLKATSTTFETALVRSRAACAPVTPARRV